MHRIGEEERCALIYLHAPIPINYYLFHLLSACDFISSFNPRERDKTAVAPDVH